MPLGPTADLPSGQVLAIESSILRNTMASSTLDLIVLACVKREILGDPG